MKTDPAGQRPEHRRPKSAFYDHYAALPDNTDFRAHPELYRVGKGEQGVLMVEPYKSELLPLWRFATPAVATESAAALYQAFRSYLAAGDFVGADMARKFLQMGYEPSWFVEPAVKVQGHLGELGTQLRQVVLFDHETLAVLFEKKTNLRRCQQRLELDGIGDDGLDFKKLHGFE